MDLSKAFGFLSLLLATFIVVHSNRPQLTLQVRDGRYADLEGLDPSITWKTKGTSGEYDLECGIDVSARPTSDIASLPKSIWGKASREWNGWGFQARAEIERDVPDQAKVEFEASTEEDDFDIKLIASAGKEMLLKKIEATKGFESGDSRISVNPRFEVDTELADVVLGWENDKTYVEVIASRECQSVKVSQQLDDDNRVAPLYATNGTIAVEWEKQIDEDNSVLTTLRPNENVEVEWRDHSWTANVKVPIEGTAIGGPEVTVKREVKF